MQRLRGQTRAVALAEQQYLAAVGGRSPQGDRGLAVRRAGRERAYLQGRLDAQAGAEVQRSARLQPRRPGLAGDWQWHVEAGEGGEADGEVEGGRRRRPGRRPEL